MIHSLPLSPIQRLLLSNEAPDDEEAAQILDAITTVEAQLPEMTHTTVSLMAKYRLHRARQFLDAHKRILHPLRRLPPEIVVEIVSHLTDPGQLPWLGSHICSSWRSIVLSTPTLWSALPSLALSLRTRAPSYLAYIRHILVCSGTLPLSVTISAPLFRSRTHPLIDVIVDHSTRWQHFKLHIPFNLLPSFVAIKHRLPILESLEIDIVDVPTTIASLPPLDLFADCPALHHFTNSSSSTNFTLHLPLHQLTHYTGTLSRADIVHTQLSQFSSTALSSLVLHDTTYSYGLPANPNHGMLTPSPPTTSQSVVELTALTHLEINLFFHGPREFPFLFPSPTSSTPPSTPLINVPNLCSLSIIDTTPSIIPHLTSLLQRSGCPQSLKTLSLISHSPNAGDILELLKAMPGLEKAKMSVPPHADDILGLAIPSPPKNSPTTGGPSQNSGPSLNGPLALLPPLRQMEIVAPKLTTLEFVSQRVTLSDMATLDAINALARSRCLGSKSRSTGDALGRARVLQHLSITFPSFHSCHLQRSLLEGWDEEIDRPESTSTLGTPSPSLSAPSSAPTLTSPTPPTPPPAGTSTSTRKRMQFFQLERLKDQLLEQIPELKIRNFNVPWGTLRSKNLKKYHKKWAGEVLKVLDDIKCVGGEEGLDGKVIFSSMLYHYLKLLSDLGGWDIGKPVATAGPQPFAHSPDSAAAAVTKAQQSNWWRASWSLSLSRSPGVEHSQNPFDVQQRRHRKSASVSSTASASSTSTSASSTSTSSVTSSTYSPSSPGSDSPFNEIIFQITHKAAQILSVWRPAMDQCIKDSSWFVGGDFKSVIHLGIDAQKTARVEGLIYGFE